MFRLIQTHAPGGDACAPYDVKFDKPYTIGELVNEVLATLKKTNGANLKLGINAIAGLTISLKSNTDTGS